MRSIVIAIALLTMSTADGVNHRAAPQQPLEEGGGDEQRARSNVSFSLRDDDFVRVAPHLAR